MVLTGCYVMFSLILDLTWTSQCLLHSSAQASRICVCLQTFESPLCCDLDSLFGGWLGWGGGVIGGGARLTWGEEAVQVTDDGAERGPEHGLVVHAAGDEVGQLGPLGGRQLVAVLVEQGFLSHTG